MNIFPLFPTPIGFFEYEGDFSKELLNFVDTAETHNNMGNTTSNNKYVLREKEFEELKTFIDSSVDEYFKSTYAPKHDVRLEITQSWLNYSKTGEWHHKHSHANSLVSGVFYINTNIDSDKIIFSKKYYNDMQIYTEDYNEYNSQTWWFPVNKNLLVLFPSTLEHHVDPVADNETRISLAFNTFPKGYIGNEKNLTALHL